MIDASRFKNDARDPSVVCPGHERLAPPRFVVIKLFVLSLGKPIRIQFVSGNIYPPLGRLLRNRLPGSEWYLA